MTNHSLPLACDILGVRFGSQQLFPTCLRIGISLCCLDCLSTAVIEQQVPNTATTRHGKQPQLSVTGLASQELQHLLWVGAGEPFFFCHGVTPCPVEGPEPSSVVHAASAVGNGRECRRRCSPHLRGRRQERGAGRRLPHRRWLGQGSRRYGDSTGGWLERGRKDGKDCQRCS